MPSDDHLLNEAKQTLDELIAEGYTLRQVKLAPQKGCRICKFEQDLHLTVIFAGQKLIQKKLFLYCMAKVCIPCLALGEADEMLSQVMTEASGA